MEGREETHTSGWGKKEELSLHRGELEIITEGCCSHSKAENEDHFLASEISDP